jgi:hypothetical protein
VIEDEIAEVKKAKREEEERERDADEIRCNQAKLLCLSAT